MLEAAPYGEAPLRKEAALFPSSDPYTLQDYQAQIEDALRRCRRVSEAESALQAQSRPRSFRAGSAAWGRWWASARRQMARRQSPAAEGHVPSGSGQAGHREHGMAFLRVGAMEVRTMRRHGSRPMHVARCRANVIAYRTLCGIDKARSEWIIRPPGTLVDENELCRHCLRHGAIEVITGLAAKHQLPRDIAGDYGHSD